MSSRVISRAVAFACLAMVASACAGGAVPASTTSTQQGASTLPPVVTTAADSEALSETAPTEPQQAESPTTSAPAAERPDPDPDPDRPIAPDFSLALADGSTFLLSQETRPVFMVFWAEW